MSSCVVSATTNYLLSNYLIPFWLKMAKGTRPLLSFRFKCQRIIKLCPASRKHLSSWNKQNMAHRGQPKPFGFFHPFDESISCMNLGPLFFYRTDSDSKLLMVGPKISIDSTVNRIVATSVEIDQMSDTISWWFEILLKYIQSLYYQYQLI